MRCCERGQGSSEGRIDSQKRLVQFPLRYLNLRPPSEEGTNSEIAPRATSEPGPDAGFASDDSSVMAYAHVAQDWPILLISWLVLLRRSLTVSMDEEVQRVDGLSNSRPEVSEIGSTVSKTRTIVSDHPLRKKTPRSPSLAPTHPSQAMTRVS